MDCIHSPDSLSLSALLQTDFLEVFFLFGAGGLIFSVLTSAAAAAGRPFFITVSCGGSTLGGGLAASSAVTGAAVFLFLPMVCLCHRCGESTRAGPSCGLYSRSRVQCGAGRLGSARHLAPVQPSPTLLPRPGWHTALTTTSHTSNTGH